MADAIESYLRRGIVDNPRWLMEGDAGEGVSLCVVIPSLGEPELFTTLADLAAAPAVVLRTTLVTCVINNRIPGDARSDDIESNLEALHRLRTQSLPPLRLAWIDASSAGKELPLKEGVGLARKIGGDAALRILVGNERPDAGIICLDGDTRVDADYLPALHEFFGSGRRWAAVIDYKHQLPNEPKLRSAITRYERHLRAYEHGLSQAGSPYAFHTIGSTMASTARAYAVVRGVPRRLAGEDFYFLQKLAKAGPVEHVSGTVVLPSARPSHRVPFGTGRAVQKLLNENEEQMTYPPESYEVLREWLLLLEDLPKHFQGVMQAASEIHPALPTFLKKEEIEKAWKVISRHRSPGAHMPYAHQWFDALKTLKLFHHLREHAFPDMPVALGYPQEDS